MQTPYRPLRAASSLTLPLRGLDMRLHCWGEPGAATPERPLLVLVHGWMDVGASWQFTVDELARLEGEHRAIVALDWRGFGGSANSGSDAYWFPDYLGDLDALLDALSPASAVDLVGHSMGGNVSMSYGGVRPQRVRRLVNVEGFGLPDMPSEHAPTRLAQWLDELKTPLTMRPYATLEEAADRLRRNNPRLSPDRAAWLAPHWCARGDDGLWHVRGDTAHKRTNPILYRAAEIVATWRRIAAPVLWVEGRQTDVSKFWGDRYPRSEFESRLAVVPKVDRVAIDECGHMVHFDQPRTLAAALHDFL